MALEHDSTQHTDTSTHTETDTHRHAHTHTHIPTQQTSYRNDENDDEDRRRLNRTVWLKARGTFRFTYKIAGEY